MIREGVVYRENSRTYSVVYYVQLKFGIIHLATACYAHLHATINPFNIENSQCSTVVYHYTYGIYNIRQGGGF